jgi:hypothetical protein
MFGSYITRRAAEKLARTVQQVNQAARQSEGFARQDRMFLAKTTAAHATGVSQDVDIYIGEKGAEVQSGQTVSAYNRIADFDAEEWVYIRWIGDGWEILNSVRSADASPCGVCSSVGGLIVPVVEDVNASTHYSFSPLCDGSLYLTFEWSFDLTWVGSADTMTLDCGEGSPRSLIATMTTVGIDPGDLLITISDGSANVAVYTNHAAWQPCVPLRMQLIAYDTTCPCAPWDPWCCLTPLAGV